MRSRIEIDLGDMGREPGISIPGYKRNSYFDYDTNLRLMGMVHLWHGGASIVIPNYRLKSTKLISKSTIKP